MSTGNGIIAFIIILLQIEIIIHMSFTKMWTITWESTWHLLHLQTDLTVHMSLIFIKRNATYTPMSTLSNVLRILSIGLFTPLGFP